MIDAHCHLNFHKFDSDRDEVVARTFEKGIKHIINTGTSIPSSRLAVTLANKYPHMSAIIGIHPHHADKSDVEFEGVLVDDWLKELENLARSSEKVIGIGEIGMDYWHYKSNGTAPQKLQEDAFRSQIELSIQLKLPLQIHTRLAWDDTLSILNDYKNELQTVPGMFHCFSGSIDFARKVLGAGFYVGFDGNITYPGVPPKETTALRDLVDYIPLDRIVTETDSPFLTPLPLRGQRNEPSYAILVGRAIAQIKRVSIEEVADQTVKNTLKVFTKLSL